MTDNECATLKLRAAAIKARVTATIERSQARIEDSERRIKRTDGRVAASSSTSPQANASPLVQAARLGVPGPSANDAGDPTQLPERTRDGPQEDQYR